MWYRRNGTKSLFFEKLLPITEVGENTATLQLHGKLVWFFKTPSGIDDLLKKKTEGPSVKPIKITK